MAKSSNHTLPAALVGVLVMALAQACVAAAPAVWTLTGVSPRHYHAMAYDSARGVVVLFGGYDGVHTNETWEWDGVAWALRATTGPGPRCGHAMAYDGGRGVVVLFGAHDDVGVYLSDTWEWDGAAWTLRATTGPSRRACSAMQPPTPTGVFRWGGSSACGCSASRGWPTRSST